MKTCTKCKIEKPLDQFRFHRQASQRPDSKSKGRCSWCRGCVLSQNKIYYRNNYARTQIKIREWRERNKAKYLDYMKRRYRDNPSKVKDYDLQRRYGITLEQYQEILFSQSNRCAICESENPGGKGRYFHVDHCHKTGIVRGLLCVNCNRAIGHLQDDPDIAKKAMDYMISAREGWTSKRA